MQVKRWFGIKIGDVFLMAAILLAAFLLFVLPFFAKASSKAEIYITETQKTLTVSLNKNDDYVIKSNGVTLTVCVLDGKIYVSQSSCRDSICRNTPPISKVGQSIVCAPAGVIISIVGEEAVVDGITG